MEQNQSGSSVANDVLHSENHSKLTPEEVAKAIAHHNRHHSGDNQQNSPAKGGQSKNQGTGKSK